MLLLRSGDVLVLVLFCPWCLAVVCHDDLFDDEAECACGARLDWDAAAVGIAAGTA